MKKKSNISRDFLPNKEINRKCDSFNCDKDGKYLAPKTPGSKDMYLFCMEHVKNYNKRWNYFAGKSQSEIYDFQKNDHLESRPTRPFSRAKNSSIKFEFEHSFNKSKINFQKKKIKFHSCGDKFLSAEVKRSLEVFEIFERISKNLIKTRYKELVKKYHPDLNKNFIDQDKKIREINKAYRILIKFIEKENAAN